MVYCTPYTYFGSLLYLWNICMYICVCVCVFVYMYVYMYTCIHVCVYMGYCI